MTDTSPMGCTWQRYLEQLSDEHGGWTVLTRMLVQRAGPSVGLPDDPGTIERGLRRLKTRGNAPGGQYGRWLLRYFGMPRPLEDTARWMGQYHSRFADLPLSLREAQLWLWDRPPITESSAACWIHLGLASVALRRQDPEDARLRLALAHDATHPAAQVESALLEARLEMDTGHTARADELLAQAQACIAQLAPSGDQDCYHARWADQRAYHLIHAGTVPRLDEAARLYRSINAHSPAAFALFRRDHGLAYCHWKLGDHDRAIQHARAAVDQAGDAGLLRFRVMALHLLAHIEPGEARRLHRRADRIIAELEHTDLKARPDSGG
jgi:tetratricopeptide (TPR) repeat protein